MRVLIFGLGAVGAVLATALHQLGERAGRAPTLGFAVRDEKRARAALGRNRVLRETARFLDFEDAAGFAALQPDLVINASVPELNNHIADVALSLRAHYADMASDIYGEPAPTKPGFSQRRLNADFLRIDRFGLINLGFSPGLTNFVIGEKIAHLASLPERPRIRAVRLFLLEELISSRVLFSWSPKVALDELMAWPACIRRGELVRQAPFSRIRPFCFDPGRETETYPVFQEELLSLHDSYPEIEEIDILCGGNEVELFKNLFQLNLLSRDVKIGSAPVEQVVRKVLPKMKSPRVIEYYSRRRIIKSARFEAVAEIETEADGEKPIVERVGIRFCRYHDLLGTPYSGATYIAYPTGVTAAVLLHHALLARDRGHRIAGVLSPEALPEMLDTELTDRIKRELVGHGLEFTSHMGR